MKWLKKTFFSTLITLILCVTIGRISFAQNSPSLPHTLLDEHDINNYQADYHSAWKTSPNGMKRATIDGRGENANEEGQGVLIIKNKDNHLSKVFTMNPAEESQDTLKYVEWIDNDRVFIIVGSAYGTISKGGKLYELNLSTNTLTPIINHLKKNEEVVSVHKNGDGGFTYEKYVYNNSNLTKGHIEVGNFPVSALK